MNILFFIAVTVAAVPITDRDQERSRKYRTNNDRKLPLSRKNRFHMESQIYELRNNEIVDTSNRTGKLIARYLKQLNQNQKRATLSSPNHRRRSDRRPRRKHDHQPRPSPNARNNAQNNS